MRDRWYRKGSAPKPDPAVGRAQEANVALSERAQQWNEDFYAKYVVPMLELSGEETRENIRINKEISDLAMAQAKRQDERYTTIGLPAEDKYLAELGKFSAPEFQETQAQRALGDLNTAFAVDKASQDRAMRGLGIDPTSPMARRAVTDMGIQQAAIRAGAATRARDAAKEAGVAALGEAANIGKGMAAGLTGFSQLASGAVGAGTQAAQAGVGSAVGGAAPVNTGLGLAGQGYRSNLDSATSIYNTRQQIKAQSQGSFMGGIGKLVGLGLTAAMPGAGGVGGSVLGSIISSDRRLKKAAKRISTLAHDIGLWAFRYIWEPDSAPLRYGFMADEVERVFPEAVLTDARGFKMVDYGKVLV